MFSLKPQSQQKIKGLRLVRFENEHDYDTPYVFESKNGWLNIVKKIFTQRDNQGEYRYYTENNSKPIAPEKLPNGSPEYAVAEYDKHFAKYQRDLQYYKEENYTIKLLKNAREQNNILAMEAFLYLISDGEYQGFYFHNIENYG